MTRPGQDRFANWADFSAVNRYILLHISVLLMTILPLRWLEKGQSLQGVTLASIIVNYVPYFIGLTLICQWALQSRPERLSAFFGPEQINLMIFSIYLACIFSICAIVIHPRLVNLEKRQKNKTMPKVCMELFIF